MIRRTSQNLRPPKREEKEASLLAIRLAEAVERRKREREQAET
jgi:hypothetical protein